MISAFCAKCRDWRSVSRGIWRLASGEDSRGWYCTRCGTLAIRETPSKHGGREDLDAAWEPRVLIGEWYGYD